VHANGCCHRQNGCAGYFSGRKKAITNEVGEGSIDLGIISIDMKRGRALLQ